MRKFPLLLTAATLALTSFQGVAHSQSMSYSVSRYSPRQDPARNNYLSARYDRLLQTSWRFRRYRMWKECHRVNFTPELHASCIASFDQYEPFLGRRR